MAPGEKGKLFKDVEQASKYMQFRPTYGEDLFTAVFEYAEPGSTDLAVDLGCGSGQAAVELAKKYKEVIAMDPSEAQLAQAPRLPNLQYKCGPAESTGLPDHCADLVTVAQALHWMDVDRFFAEARRVLKPGGTLAVWGYELMRFDIPAADDVMQGLFDGTLGPYWDEGRHHVDRRYQGMEPPEGPFTNIKRMDLDMHRQMTVAALMGHLRSWSGYITYRKEVPDAEDSLLAFKPRIMQACGVSRDEDVVSVRYPIFLILAKTAA